MINTLPIHDDKGCVKATSSCRNRCKELEVQFVVFFGGMPMNLLDFFLACQVNKPMYSSGHMRVWIKLRTFLHIFVH